MKMMVFANMRLQAMTNQIPSDLCSYFYFAIFVHQHTSILKYLYTLSKKYLRGLESRKKILFHEKLDSNVPCGQSVSTIVA